MRTRAGTLWLGCLTMVVLVSRAEGGDAYEEAYQRGKALEKEGQATAAAGAYEEALRKGGPGHIRLTIAKVWLGAGEVKRAQAEVQRYRREVQVPNEGLVGPLEAQIKARLPKATLPKPPREEASQPLQVPADMVLIQPGKFQMGSPANEPGRDTDERQHGVKITRPYLLGRTEVTQGQYEEVMGTNPSGNKASKEHPVENVSWFDAVEYCNKRSVKEGLSACYVIRGEQVNWPKGLNCRGYRLPTEAEWEYAARAGGKTVYSGSDTLSDVAWHRENSDRTTHPVGRLKPNGWGLYDMSGNVWEWVWDWYGSYPQGPVVDPTGLKTGQSRVCRGGSWGYGPGDLRVAARGWGVPADRGGDLGFRLARSLP